jgi:hypothetical protein
LYHDQRHGFGELAPEPYESEDHEHYASAAYIPNESTAMFYSAHTSTDHADSYYCSSNNLEGTHSEPIEPVNRNANDHQNMNNSMGHSSSSFSSSSSAESPSLNHSAHHAAYRHQSYRAHSPSASTAETSTKSSYYSYLMNESNHRHLNHHDTDAEYAYTSQTIAQNNEQVSIEYPAYASNTSAAYYPGPETGVYYNNGSIGHYYPNTSNVSVDYNNHYYHNQYEGENAAAVAAYYQEYYQNHGYPHQPMGDTFPQVMAATSNDHAGLSMDKHKNETDLEDGDSDTDDEETDDDSDADTDDELLSGEGLKARGAAGVGSSRGAGRGRGRGARGAGKGASRGMRHYAAQIKSGDGALRGVDSSLLAHQSSMFLNHSNSNSMASDSLSGMDSVAATSGRGARANKKNGGGSNGSGKKKRKRILNRLQRQEATLREKRRMLKLNKAFEELRKVLPISEFAKNKLSRAETLKSAIEYIEKMSELLQII